MKKSYRDRIINDILDKTIIGDLEDMGYTMIKLPIRLYGNVDHYEYVDELFLTDTDGYDEISDFDETLSLHFLRDSIRRYVEKQYGYPESHFVDLWDEFLKRLSKKIYKYEGTTPKERGLIQKYWEQKNEEEI